MKRPLFFLVLWRFLKQAIKRSGRLGWYASSKLLRISVWLTLMTWCLLCVLVLCLRYYFLPNIETYRPELQQRLSSALGLNVEVKKMVANWDGLRPELTLIGVTMTEKNGTRALEIPRVKSVLSWASLPLRAPIFSSLQIESPGLEVVRTAEQKLRIGGISIDLNQPNHSAFGEWFLEQDEIIIRGAGLRYVDETRATENLPPLDFQSVTFVLRNRGQHHRFAFFATPPAALATPLDLRGDFRHRYFAQNKADWREWVGEAYVHFDYANWTALKPYVSLPIALDQAQGALRSWITVQHGELEDSVSDVALQNVSLRLRADLPSLELRQLHGRIQARQLQAKAGFFGHEIELENFRFTTQDGAHFLTDHLHERLMFKPDGTPEAGALKADVLDLASVAKLATHLPLPAYYRDWLLRFQPRGELRQLQLNWRGPPETPQDYALDTQFQALALKAQRTDPTKAPTAPHHFNLAWPGFENFTGSLRMTPQQGRLKLNASNSAVIFPGLFERERIALQRVVGQLNWRPTPAGYEFELLPLVLENTDAQGVFKGVYQSGRDAWVDLQGQLTRADARAVQHYLPLTVPQATRTWVKQAVQAGTSNEVRFEMKGPLQDWPYDRSRNGRFFIGAKIQAATLQPAPRWPVLENLYGHLIFEGNGLRAENVSAQLQGVRAQEGKVVLADFSAANSRVEINANLQGELGSYWQYLKASPLQEKLPAPWHALQATGPAKLALSLALPLDEVVKTQVRGELSFGNNDIRLNPAWPSLNRVNGRIEFNESGAAARNLSAIFLGGPVRLTSPIVTNKTANLSPGFQAQAEGNFNLSDAQVFSDAKALKAAKGNVRYSAKLKLSEGAVEAQFDSNLQGVALEFPAPLSKTANSNLPLQLRLKQAAQSEKMQSHFKLGDWQALLESQWDSTTKASKIQRAAIQLSATNSLPSLPTEGTTVQWQAPVFNLEAWHSLIDDKLSEADKKVPASGAIGGSLPLPITVNLKTEQLQIAGKNFNQFNARAFKRDATWAINLDSPQLQGSIAWRDAGSTTSAGRVVARFSRLAIPKSQASDWAELLDAAPLQDMPALNIEAENFELNDKLLGKLELVANNVQRAEAREWQLQKLAISHGDATFNATGNWSRVAASKQRLMQLDFNLDTPNAGKTLERLGMKNLLRGGATQLQGQIFWRGSPLAIDYPSLGGAFKLTAAKGQFLKVEPGVGRLIGVLSLQSIPKRLSLDFRDVFSEGFAFDAINASVQLQNGVASTHDFKMRGLNATVLMEGSANVAQETQNLRVLVLPEINAAGASVMYALLANPAIGLGTFLAQMVLREPLAKAFSYEYQVTGSWDDPQVSKAEKNTPRPVAEK